MRASSGSSALGTLTALRSLICNAGVSGALLGAERKLSAGESVISIELSVFSTSGVVSPGPRCHVQLRHMVSALVALLSCAPSSVVRTLSMKVTRSSLPAPALMVAPGNTSLRPFIMVTSAESDKRALLVASVLHCHTTASYDGFVQSQM